MKSSILTLVLAAAGLIFASASANACCGYGCCDCSCIAIFAEEKAAEISKAVEQSMIGKDGPIRVQSFTIDASDRAANVNAPFSCAPTKTGAICTRER